MTEAEQIEAIYNAYPRKVGRRAALKAIENAVKRISAHKGAALSAGIDLSPLSCRRWLCKRVMEYAWSPAGQKPPDPAHDYRPHPATWMNQERYFDDPAEWQKPNGGSNGRQQAGTKAERTVDSARAAIERIENRNRAGAIGDDAGRGVQSANSGDVCGRTIEGTV